MFAWLAKATPSCPQAHTPDSLAEAMDAVMGTVIGS